MLRSLSGGRAGRSCEVKAAGCCEPQHSRCGQVKCLTPMTQLLLKHQPASGFRSASWGRGLRSIWPPFSPMLGPDIFSQYVCWAGGQRGLFSLMPFKYIIIIIIIVTLFLTFTPSLGKPGFVSQVHQLTGGWCVQVVCSVSSGDQSCRATQMSPAEHNSEHRNLHNHTKKPTQRSPQQGAARSAAMLRHATHVT